nr:AAA family ATPase [Nitrosomonas nitrosa]
MDSRLIFVTGAHGVGKSHLAHSAARELNVACFTASELIAAELGRSSWDGNRHVSEMNKNQDALLSAARGLRDRSASSLLLGYLVLRTTAGAHRRVSVKVLEQLRISGMVAISASASTVLGRLRLRGDMSWTEPEIRSLLENESEYATEVSRQMSVPLRVLFEPDELSFAAAVHGLLAY